MKKNLNGKIALIVAVLAVCVYGIFGVPSGVTGKALTEALTKRIHLGLDLRGGAHLILQVEVQEAVNADTDNTVARIRQDLKAANLSFSQVYKPDPAKADQIRVEGTTPGSDVRSVLEAKYAAEYDVNDGSTPNSFTLTMKPLIKTALKRRLQITRRGSPSPASRSRVLQCLVQPVEYFQIAQSRRFGLTMQIRSIALGEMDERFR